MFTTLVFFSYFSPKSIAAWSYSSVPQTLVCESILLKAKLDHDAQIQPRLNSENSSYAATKCETNFYQFLNFYCICTFLIEDATFKKAQFFTIR